MNKTQVNMLVADYRNGNELALDEIFRKVNPLIESASRIIEKVSDDPTKFDCRVLLKIKKAVEDPTIRDFAGYVKTIIGNERSDFLNRRRRKREDISMAALEGESDEDLGYQFKSTDNTEHDVEFKERVTLLAQGNPKKESILQQWSRGAEDKAISELLAQRFGGKAESHRKFIQRFKTECRNRLASEMA
jgi:DNA-directed RNA polymerase specialized sigma24 family protein